MKYKRILLKLSGEALSKNNNIINDNVLNDVIYIIQSVIKRNIELAIVIGGGNIVRGHSLAKTGINRVTGDYVGMLATVINALVINDKCKAHGIKSSVMSAFTIDSSICDKINISNANKLLANKEVVIFSAGTGNPYFTTDSAASLRAIEINADILLKATNTDGVYSADPKINNNATKYDSISFDDVINQNLKIMDATAFTLCKEHNLDICVFSMLNDIDTLGKILDGKKLGTIISNK